MGIVIIIIIIINIIIIIVISLVRPELTASPLRGLFARSAPSQARVRCAVSKLGADRAVRSFLQNPVVRGSVAIAAETVQ